MSKAALLILGLYAMANVGIIYYFFVYKQREIDREYREAMDRIYSKGRTISKNEHSLYTAANGSI